VLIQNRYEGDLLAEQTYANGDRYQFFYSLAANRHYAERATVRLPDRTTRSFQTGDSVYQFFTELEPKASQTTSK
jgi:hypothetical protein